MKLSSFDTKVGDESISINYRLESDGDKGVIHQIFNNLDYEVRQWKQGVALVNYYNELPPTSTPLIIDAGANIGASALYFINTFKKSFVYSVEPDLNNWHILEINTADYENKYNFNGGIASADGNLKLIDPGLSDWGFRTEPTNELDNVVRCISPQTILESDKTNGMTPFIFKIDIEGAEAELFQDNVSWMNKFPLIVIELHDWMLPFSGSSKNFLKSVCQYDFDFIHRGENVFLFNRSLLK
jgi:FkbM family methyltransferase